MGSSDPYGFGGSGLRASGLGLITRLSWDLLIPMGLGVLDLGLTSLSWDLLIPMGLGALDLVLRA